MCYFKKKITINLTRISYINSKIIFIYLPYMYLSIFIVSERNLLNSINLKNVKFKFNQFFLSI